MTAAGSVAGALAAATDAAKAGLDRLDAQLLLAHVLDRGRTWLLAHGEESLSADALQRFGELVERRSSGVPLAYLVGRREFHGLDLVVTPAVLVPRPDSEVLVEWAIELAREQRPAGVARRLIDLGTGSGAVALALRHALAPDAWAVTATDVSGCALAVARLNAERLGLPLRLVQGDWWDAVPGESFDLAVANPPYVAEGDPHLTALVHEPIGALTSGPRGMDALLAIIDGLPAALHDGGWLVLEHGHDQADAVGAALQRKGCTDIATRNDLGGNARCTGGRSWRAADGTPK